MSGAKEMPVVACVVHELATALAGNPIVVSTLDGQKVQLRLATVDEFLAAHHAAIAAQPEGFRPEPVTREFAERLVKPIDLFGGVS